MIDYIDLKLLRPLLNSLTFPESSWHAWHNKERLGISNPQSELPCNEVKSGTQVEQDNDCGIILQLLIDLYIT